MWGVESCGEDGGGGAVRGTDGGGALQTLNRWRRIAGFAGNREGEGEQTA